MDDPTGGGTPPDDRSPDKGANSSNSKKGSRRSRGRNRRRRGPDSDHAKAAFKGGDLGANGNASAVNRNGVQRQVRRNSDASAPDASANDQVRTSPQSRQEGGEQSFGHKKHSRRRRRRRNQAEGVAQPAGRQHGSNIDLASTGNNAHPNNNTRQPQRAGEHRHRRAPVKSDDPVRFHAVDNNAEASSANANAGERNTRKRRSNRNSNHNKRHRRAGECYAALDLGTNNCRLLVAVPQAPGNFKVIDAFSRIVRLGEGLGGSGRLKESSMDRAIEALQVCANKLAVKNIRMQRLIATEACRRAENGSYFLERVLAETGLDLEIVNRRTEARLAVSGCSTLVGENTDGVVLFDIGGGSSELALLDVRKCNNRRLSDHIVAWTSMPLGVVTLAEKHGGEKVSPAVFTAMVDEVKALLAKFEGRDALEEASRSGRMHLLGTSGTVTTLAGVHLELKRYDRRRVDGIWMDDGDVAAMIDKLLAMDYEARTNNPCIGRDRADLVLAGCAILEAIRQTWPCPRLRVADRGLREGLLTEMMAEDGVWRRRGNGRNRQSNRNRNAQHPNGPGHNGAAQ